MKQRVINLIGGPCSGKSTAAAGLFAKLNKTDQSVELVREVAKDYVWEGSCRNLSDQIYIFGQQYHRQKVLEGKVDWIITDSPLLLSMCYSLDCSENFFRLILEKFREFDNLTYFIDRGVSEFSPLGRVHNYEQSIQVDHDIKELLKMYDIPYTIVQQDTAVDEILRYLSRK